MKKLLRSTISSLCYPVSRLSKGGVAVLMYHRVNDALKPSDLVVSTQTFRQQMEFLRRNKYEVIGIRELAFHSRSAILISFDDGYRDNYLNAYPILKEYGFPAVIFLTTGLVGTDKARPRYQHLPKPDMLSWEEAREMAKNKVEFGAHTVSHPRLAQIPLNEAKREIEQSRDNLRQFAPKAFCYPYGDFNEEVKRMVKDAGFSCAFTVEPGMVKPDTDRFALPRIGMNGIDTLFDFRKKLWGAFVLLHWMVRKSEKEIT